MKINIPLSARIFRPIKSTLKPIFYLPLKAKLSRQLFDIDNSGKPAISYAGIVSSEDATSGGGRVKLLYLSRIYPERKHKFNILYLVSSNLPACFETWIRKCKKMGIKIVLNQNGVAYPGWYGPGWKRINSVLKTALHSADYVIYQSKFAKASSDNFLGEVSVPWNILYNSVDTSIFSPGEKVRGKNRPFTLLIAGSHNQFYRFEAAVRVFSILRNKDANLRLCVAGRLNWSSNARRIRIDTERLLKDYKVANVVQLLGPYSQVAAPELFKNADILLHTQYNDVCPTLVLEAMACGLPVVYIKSGGTPELVGETAGVGIDTELSWEKIPLINAELLAKAVFTIMDRYVHFSQAARERVISNFDIKYWIQKHKIIFEGLLHST